ncbi:beta-L-arabinofuranosidase domain-containing protein [Bradyrhizobium sp. NBAIM01]|uniref:glycoside hydrolase family 127 protein n=1 Tax=Bradyrhizobium sp. NBAIM01 TaxID=2793818 RepID=UPI001CD40A7B|nr:beta-L-arabinofuranosidase domain-containing protein [Bradyrhizobium sp. NBAIM01]MCA1512719.1 glycoside hydrolase family 127 protein [Bradyrhizobium sp. NBAIM01]
MNDRNVAEVDLHDIQVSDPLIGKCQQLVRDVAIPYQWEVLNDRDREAIPSHAVENFRLAAGRASGEFQGTVFQDSDVAKWLEAAAWSLCQAPSPELEKAADELIELVAAAQCDDGYLNTYFTLNAPQERWTNLAECHELYCAGHLIEAGVAFFQATGKRRLLEVVRRLADHLDTVFGPERDQLHGYDGHPEIELALARLYEVTKEQRYLTLANYFVEQRGTKPHFYEIEYEKRQQSGVPKSDRTPWMITNKAYSQAHLPLSEQRSATGHAVRFVYLMTAVAHLARLRQNEEQRQACLRLWQNMVQRQIYVTGAIGSQGAGEAFSSDFDLPNDTAYAESCASIGLMMFARRMLEMELDSRYADVMERALYNTVLGSIAFDGRHYFYVNPLEVHPETLRSNGIYNHVSPVRRGWFGCACCPPNIARLFTSIGHYIYTARRDALYVNLYVGNRVAISVGGYALRLLMSGSYPWKDEVEIVVESAPPMAYTLALRLPEWCNAPQASINDEPVNCEPCKGYLHIRRSWRQGDRVKVSLPMQVRRVYGHPQLRNLAGKVAIQRGPLIYCLEEADNGTELHNVWLHPDSRFSLIEGTGLFNDKILLQAEGARLQHTHSEEAALYQYDKPRGQLKPQRLTFIPWFGWANRGEGEMRIWLNER